MAKTWAEMTPQERWDHSARHGTDWHRNNPNPSGSITDFVNQQAGNITVTQPSEFLQALAGEDVVHNRLYTSDPALDPKSNYAETQQAAQNIQNAGFQGQDGDYFYNTGNPDLNQALYGNDVYRNMSYDNQGWEIPRHLQDNQAADIIEAVAGGILTAGLGGGGLFSAIGNIAQGGATVGNVGNVIYNLNDMYQDVTEDDPGPAPSITGGIFGDEFGVDFDGIIDAGPGLLGDIMNGGRYDQAILDIPGGGNPQQNTNGGGGQTSADDTAAEPAPRQTGGDTQPPGPGEDDPYIYNGQGELVQVNGDNRIAVPNPGRLVTGGVYTSDAEEYSRTDVDEDLQTDNIMTPYMDNLDDLLAPGYVQNTWNTPTGSVTVTQNPTQTPGVNLPGSQNGMSPDGDMWQPGEIPGGNTNTGGTGNGSGTGNGDGSGDGDGDGDGDGEGPNEIPGGSGLLAAGAGQSGELYPYSQISPSQAATLTGLIDYVAALRRG